MAKVAGTLGRYVPVPGFIELAMVIRATDVIIEIAIGDQVLAV